MKKHINLLLIAVLLFSVPFLDGCLKKGDEDPLISLRTRKARVIGKWTLKDRTFDVSITSNDVLDSVWTFNGTSVNLLKTWTKSAHDTVHEWSGELKEGTYKFDDDGEMEYYLDFDIKRDSSYYNSEVSEDKWKYVWTERYRYDYSGTWNFLGKIDNYKNMERIAFVWTTKVTSVTYNFYVEHTDEEGTVSGTNYFGQSQKTYKYSNGEVSDIWQIIQLRNKEIKLHRDINDDDVSNVFSNDPFNPIAVDTSSFYVVGYESLTLSLKE